MNRGGKKRRKKKQKCSSPKILKSGMNKEVIVQWIQSNYRASETMCIPRDLVYTHYCCYCQASGSKAETRLVFGKLLNELFWHIRTRRFGSRGCSQNFYWGLAPTKSNEKYGEFEKLKRISVIPIRLPPNFTESHNKRALPVVTISEPNTPTTSTAQEQHPTKHTVIGVITRDLEGEETENRGQCTPCDFSVDLGVEENSDTPEQMQGTASEKKRVPSLVKETKTSASDTNKEDVCDFRKLTGSQCSSSTSSVVHHHGTLAGDRQSTAIGKDMGLPSKIKTAPNKHCTKFKTPKGDSCRERHKKRKWKFVSAQGLKKEDTLNSDNNVGKRSLKRSKTKQSQLSEKKPKHVKVASALNVQVGECGSGKLVTESCINICNTDNDVTVGSMVNIEERGPTYTETAKHAESNAKVGDSTAAASQASDCDNLDSHVTGTGLNSKEQTNRKITNRQVLRASSATGISTTRSTGSSITEPASSDRNERCMSCVMPQAVSAVTGELALNQYGSDCDTGRLDLSHSSDNVSYQELGRSLAANSDWCLRPPVSWKSSMTTKNAVSWQIVDRKTSGNVDSGWTSTTCTGSTSPTFTHDTGNAFTQKRSYGDTQSRKLGMPAATESVAPWKHSAETCIKQETAVASRSLLRKHNLGGVTQFPTSSVPAAVISSQKNSNSKQKTGSTLRRSVEGTEERSPCPRSNRVLSIDENKRRIESNRLLMDHSYPASAKSDICTQCHQVIKLVADCEMAGSEARFSEETANHLSPSRVKFLYSGSLRKCGLPPVRDKETQSNSTAFSIQSATTQTESCDLSKPFSWLRGVKRRQQTSLLCDSPTVSDSDRVTSADNNRVNRIGDRSCDVATPSSSTSQPDPERRRSRNSQSPQPVIQDNVVSNSSGAVTNDGDSDNDEVDRKLSTFGSKWLRLARHLKEEHAKQAADWINSQYEMDPQSCIPRHVVNAHYISYCKLQGHVPAPVTIFGRFLQKQFPLLTMRRLGTRSNSKYYYMGMNIRPESEDHEKIAAARTYSRVGKPKLNRVFNGAPKKAVSLLKSKYK